MSPLFIAHLIADFLLQPKWLADWKVKSLGGVIVHSLIHGLVLFALLLPNRMPLWLAIVVLAILHGVIDQVKISYQNKNGEEEFGFSLDQFAHFIILAAVSRLFRFPIVFWQSEAGQGILFLFVFLSFGIAWFNLVIKQSRELKSTAQTLLRFGSLVIVFGLFSIGS